jgi:pimeloyl-ACP methyl ester carboxylesterase
MFDFARTAGRSGIVRSVGAASNIPQELQNLYPSRAETFPYPERVMLYDRVPLRTFVAAPPAGTPVAGTVILVHGLGANLTHFEYIAPPLVADGWRVAGLDLPGFGLSGKPHRTYSIHYLSGAVLALLDHLAADEAVLCGHSLGGLVCADAALRVPHRVRGLVLISSAGLFSMPLPVRLLLRTIPWRGFLEPVLERNAGRVLSRVFHSTNERTERFVAQSTTRPDARFVPELVRVMSAARRDLVGYTLLGEAERLTMPTLVIWGERDRLLPSTEVPRWAARLPRGELEVIPACGHMSIIENPEAVVRRMLAWLRRSCAASPPLTSKASSPTTRIRTSSGGPPTS